MRNIIRGAIASVACLALGVVSTSGAAGGSPPTTITPVSAPTSLAGFTAIACWSVGNCVAGGVSISTSHSGATTHNAPIVATQVDGSWAPAVSMAALSSTEPSTVTGIACPAASQCVAVVIRITLSTKGRAPTYASYLVSQTASGWAAPQRVPVVASAHQGVQIEAIQCPVVGSCELLGMSRNSSTSGSMFVLSWRDGVFSRAHVFTVGSLGKGALDAEVLSLSCPSLGSCVVVGRYTTLSPSIRFEPFTISQVAGTWHSPQRRGAYQAASRNNSLESVSCPSPGNCVAVGASESRLTASARGELVMTETSGVWGAARLLAHAPGGATLRAVSCVSPGNCTALMTMGLGVSYGTNAGEVSETGGHWAPPSGAPSSGYSQLELIALACVSPFACTAAGDATPLKTVGRVPVVAASDSGVWQ